MTTESLNVNLLQSTSQSHELQLLLHSFYCRNVITEPTRVSHTSETLLDLFITNCSEDATKSGVIVVDMSDHLPVYMFCKFHQASKPVRQSHSFGFQEINYKTLNTFQQKICNID